MVRQVILLLLLWGTSLPAEQFWNQLQFSQWSERQVRQVLEDSPWARTVVFPAPERVGLPGTGGRRKYFVRLLSAMPVRMALARTGILSGALDSEQAQQRVREDHWPGKIVLSVSMGAGQDTTEIYQSTTEALQGSAWLSLKPSGRKLQLERYMGPIEAGGERGLFIFHRPGGLEVEDQIEFVGILGPQTRLVVRFRPSKMVFQGQLEI